MKYCTHDVSVTENNSDPIDVTVRTAICAACANDRSIAHICRLTFTPTCLVDLW